MDSLNSIASYPTNRDDWMQTVIIGGILIFIGFLLVPLVLVYGYVIRVIRRTLDGVDSPPEFDDFGELFVDGLKAWAIGIVYMLIPAVVTGVTVGSAAVSLALDGNLGATMGGLILGLTLSAILSLVFGYVGTAALVNFAREDSMAAAFDFGVIRRVVVHRDYATAWLVALVALFLASLVGSIPVIGWILAPFTGFYALTVAGNLWSDGFSAALDGTDTPGRVSGEQPTT